MLYTDKERNSKDSLKLKDNKTVMAEDYNTICNYYKTAHYEIMGQLHTHSLSICWFKISITCLDINM